MYTKKGIIYISYGNSDVIIDNTLKEDYSGISNLTVD